MIKVLGENYYIDLDKVEEYLDMSDQYSEGETSGNTETRINIIKFEMVKMLMDTVLTEHEEIDEQLGMKSSSNTSSTQPPQFSGSDAYKKAIDSSMPPMEKKEPVVAEPKAGRNDPCPCGNGRKFKKCCGQHR